MPQVSEEVIDIPSDVMMSARGVSQGFGLTDDLRQLLENTVARAIFAERQNAPTGRKQSSPELSSRAAVGMSMDDDEIRAFAIAPEFQEINVLEWEGSEIVEPRLTPEFCDQYRSFCASIVAQDETKGQGKTIAGPIDFKGPAVDHDNAVKDCGHEGYSFDKDGRCCGQCGELITDMGD